MKKQLTAWLLALVMLFSLVGCGTDAPVQDETNLPQQEQQDVQNAPSEDADMPDETAQIDEDGAYTTKDDVALYIHTYGHLPDNFITKKDAQALGWPGGSLEPYAPGKCIGGSRFGNYEGLLPEADGRTYTECDIDTLGADSRGAKRIVFSNDGLIYYTEDHYKSFVRGGVSTMRFVLDVSACESVEDLHRALAEGLRFPAWYSGNLDALHDCLTDLHEPTELIVRGTSALDELLGRRANAFRRVLDDSAEANPNLTVQFEDAVEDDTY